VGLVTLAERGMSGSRLSHISCFMEPYGPEGGLDMLLPMIVGGCASVEAGGPVY
jgi:hypothetical protein